MKAGVITFHSANNYGATLQTWALQKVLKDYGIEASVIHYHPDIIDKLYDPMMMKQGFGRSLKKLELSFLHRKSLLRYNKFQNFLQKNFNLNGDFRTYNELKEAGLNLDAYIVGSDQVWNPDHIGGFDPAYYLDFAEPGRKKIAYAASIGSDFINTKYKEKMREALGTFTGISVRERSIKDPIQELCEKKVKVVLDPTMLLVKEDYEEIKVPSARKEPYILVYMIEKNEQVIAFANMISISLGLPVIQRRNVPGFTNELESFYTADAGEFIGLIEGAEYVITNSFHGTVFSILYEKPFVSMLHSDTGSRTVDLLTELGLQSHILYNTAEFTDFSMFKIAQPKQLRTKIEDLKKSSTEFLVKSLGISDRYNKLKCPTKITKEKCYGCNACKDICPAKAIRMKEDKEGFLYPVTDKDKCTDCGMCKKVCIRKYPHTIKYEEQYPKAYSAYNTAQEVRDTSSSGGIFPALARYAIEEKKGAVVGVKLNEAMEAVADIAEDLEAARKFSGSKYVKSDFRGMFPKVKKLLKEGRFVLYTGLPCECAGLRSFLQKDYDNLLICEILCHSAPSPKVFKKYVAALSEKYQAKVVNIDFRNKKKGWKPGDNQFVVTTENGKLRSEPAAGNAYYRTFINGYISRPSCNNCNYTFSRRTGDITIGDCWGIQTIAPEMNDNKGVNLLLVNTAKGNQVFQTISKQLKLKQSDLKSVFIKNHKKPTKDRPQRISFFMKLEEKPIDELLDEYSEK
jgi:Coenzyme F420-reducing hydrogenase, beta subunit